MGGKTSRTKGHSFERLVARILRVTFPGAARGLQYRDPSACDVEGTPFRIECKRLKKVNTADVVKAIMQCETDAHNWEDHRPCIVISKEDRGKIYVTMRLGALLTIAERLFYSHPDEASILPFLTKDEA